MLDKESLAHIQDRQVMQVIQIKFVTQDLEVMQATGVIHFLEDNQNTKATWGLEKYINDKDYIHNRSHAGHGGFLDHREYAGQ